MRLQKQFFDYRRKLMRLAANFLTTIQDVIAMFLSLPRRTLDELQWFFLDFIPFLIRNEINYWRENFLAFKKNFPLFLNAVAIDAIEVLYITKAALIQLGTFLRPHINDAIIYSTKALLKLMFNGLGMLYQIFTEAFDSAEDRLRQYVILNYLRDLPSHATLNYFKNAITVAIIAGISVLSLLKLPLYAPLLTLIGLSMAGNLIAAKYLKAEEQVVNQQNAVPVPSTTTKDAEACTLKKFTPPILNTYHPEPGTAPPAKKRKTPIPTNARPGNIMTGVTVIDDFTDAAKPSDKEKCGCVH